MSSVLNGKYTLKQTIHDSCWKWKTDVLQSRESIWPWAAKTQRPKIRLMNFILLSECTCTYSGSVPCSVRIALILQSPRTVFLPAGGTEKGRGLLRATQGVSTLPSLTTEVLRPLPAPGWASREAQQRLICFTDPYLHGKCTFGLLRNVQSIYTRYLLRSLALMGKLNAARKKLAASAFSSCFCLTSEKRFQPWDLKALFSWRNRFLKGACDCWLIRSVLSWKTCLRLTRHLGGHTAFQK